MAKTVFLFLLSQIFSIQLYASVPTPTQAFQISSWALKDIRFVPADLSTASDGITIAIIDTGVDREHPFLAGSLWINPGESGLDEMGRAKETNGVDDDQNGYVDDIHGWDFVRSTPKLSDSHGHGTHIAGIIHQVAPQARLMILRYYAPTASAEQTIRWTVEAIRYAIRMNAKIINYSGGGPTSTEEEFEAIREANSAGILVVAAAGNEGANSDRYRYFPADYELENILSVTAHNQRGDLLSTSNFGKSTVDISAPGEKIRSSLPGGNFGEMTGTSQATAFASGVAAQIWPKLGLRTAPVGLIRVLTTSGRARPNHYERTLSGRSLNAAHALKLVQMGFQTPTKASPLSILNVPSQFDRAPSSPDTKLEQRAFKKRLK